MQEKDILTDILVLEKDLCKNYGSYIIESSCPKLRTLLTNNFKACVGDQFCVYDAMAKRGYYPSKDAPSPEVQQAKTKFDGISQKMQPMQS